MMPINCDNETTQVLAAFNPGNYKTISKLPFTLKPDAVNSTREATIHKNLSDSLLPKPGHATLRRHGTFNHYDYMPSIRLT